ncbi:hypothetical protein TCAL_00424 [Tigriopus californicus]|uniref:Exonuclease 1 n=1 Tax=Tigriopus californicus TaxID=6832 RepID=A0A553NC59_TIGCA|nr:exonuclease 1-like [Tigriopus californicus]TRY62949.1 hypothetical protein TCAL_00424 [Tigriopus californicus]|eukprot:TCALIF_00424-PA protein Name:"Similar to exo1 Exonuclease 1 (Danio rerio)" AED:0.12 eAED:0.12 QI:0/-1/0/1/-1/1/1/0/693
MGITGLLPFLKKSSKPVHVSQMAHSVVAVDVYCWLHKGAFGCAEKLVQNQPTQGYILYVMKYIDLFLHYNIKPVLVFDGRNLPSKAGTEKKRRDNRQKYRQMAKNYLREGKLREARECFQRCVDITPAMAREMIQACHERRIDCIVAPYEADAQLAHLNRSGLADYVISEDSDLTLFGCDKIVFKLDTSGNGVLYERSQLAQSLGQRADAFNFDKFRYMCILSGCDYLPSLHGIGLGKAFKFWSKVSNSDLRLVLPKVPGYLKMPQLDVTPDYINGFIQADRTFLYQVVFDVKTRKLQPLTPYPVDSGQGDMGDLSYAGSLAVDDEQAYQLALGNVDFHTQERVFHFCPDNQTPPCTVSQFGKAANQPSIWSKDFDPQTAVRPLNSNSKADNGVARTAFGDLKLKPSPSTNKRRSSSPSEDLIESNHFKRRKPNEKLVVEQPDSPQIEKVFISKYFSPGTTKQKEKKTTKTASVSETKVSWFSALDNETSTCDKLIYNTDLFELQSNTSTKDENTGPVQSTIPMLEQNLSLCASDASRQAFKPLKLNSEVEDTPDKKLKRNPFAKVTPDKAASPEPEVIDVEDECPAILPASQLSAFSIDRESFRFTPTLASSQELGSQEISSSPFNETATESQEVIIERTVSSVTLSQSSYFSKKTGTPKSTLKKPRGLSGLIRPSSQQQRSVLDLWKKAAN